MSEVYAGRQIVGMDLHLRRLVLVRMTETGERLETVRISNDPELAVSPEVASITAPVFFQQPSQNDYGKGFQDRYRKGHDDGMKDGKADCKACPKPQGKGLASPSEYGR